MERVSPICWMIGIEHCEIGTTMKIDQAIAISRETPLAATIAFEHSFPAERIEVGTRDYHNIWS